MKLLALFTLITCSFFVNGCVKYVYVPVTSCPKPPAIQEQILKTELLAKDATTDDKLRALAYDFVYLKQLKNQYKILLEGYSDVKEIKIDPAK